MSTNRTASRGKNTRASLAPFIARSTGNLERFETTIPSLTLFRYEQPTEPVSYMLEPSICLIAQGTKRVFLGDEVYVYDVNHYLVTSVGLPVVAQILEASSKEPYLGLTLELDRGVIAQLMADSDLPMKHPQKSSRGMAVSKVSEPILHAFERLLKLLDNPEDIPILAPLVQKEITYRLLIGEQGYRLRQIAMAGSQSRQIARAIDWLKGNYTERLRVDDLAAHASMSTSNFHHHFRALTALSPLQYQKRLRLTEARRLMLTEDFDAATAAFRVGYESPSQFSREYSRMFGAPPLRDIKNLQIAASA